ncbi:MAG TPA: hypothetical protein VHH32_07985 [Gemmatimonadales bacterium]|nr:hypothetical protein [Gemmatimonadales bacterium]
MRLTVIGLLTAATLTVGCDDDDAGDDISTDPPIFNLNMAVTPESFALAEDSMVAAVGSVMDIDDGRIVGNPLIGFTAVDTAVVTVVAVVGPADDPEDEFGIGQVGAILQAAGDGATQVIASFPDLNRDTTLTDTIQVTVVNSSTASLTFEDPPASVPAGETVELLAVPRTAGGTVLESRLVNFALAEEADVALAEIAPSEENPNAAFLTANDSIGGTVEVVATSGTVSTTITVTVEPPPPEAAALLGSDQAPIAASRITDTKAFVAANASGAPVTTKRVALITLPSEPERDDALLGSSAAAILKRIEPAR